MTQKQLRQELRDIENNAPSRTVMFNDYMELINRHVKEVIGEDEEEPVNVEHPYYEKYCEEVRMRNVLREEQRIHAKR